MIVLGAGIALIAFLLYGALLMSRLRAEDPAEWSTAVLAESGISLRLHPGWKEAALEAAPETSSGVFTGSSGPAWSFRTGIPEAQLTIEVLPALGLTLHRRLARLLASLPFRLDESQPEPFSAGPHPGLRTGSAATTTDGSRLWIELHLVEGPAGTLLLAYRCPVLSGSREGLALVRCAESVRFAPVGRSVPCEPFGPGETSRALGQ